MLKSRVVKKVSLIVLLGLVILSFAILPKKVSAQGYSGCLYIYSPFIPDYVCVRDTDHFNCDPGYTDICSQFNGDQVACESAYHICTPNTTPTPPPGYYRCKWLYSPFIPGWVCVLDNNHCTSGVADCSLYHDQASCEFATHMCVVNTPTPPAGVTGVQIGSIFHTPFGNTKGLADLVSVILSNAVVIAGIILFILILAGGIMMIAGAGSGNKEGVGKGRTAVTAAVIGFLIIFAAYWIMLIMENIFKIPIRNPGF
jgi:hypothetical protein